VASAAPLRAVTVKPRLNQRLLFAAATGSFDLCPPGAFFKLGSTEEQDGFLASREITDSEFEEPKEMLKTCTLDLANYAKKVKWSLEFFCAMFGIEHHAERSQFFNFLMYLHARPSSIPAEVAVPSKRRLWWLCHPSAVRRPSFWHL
jgi:hypothetical protein